MDRKYTGALRAAIMDADYGRAAEMIGQDGSLLNARLSGNVTPLMFALILGNSQFAHWLIGMGAKVDIVTAVMLGDTESVRDFLERRPWLIRKHDPWGAFSLLHIGARYGDSAMVKLLLEYGIDPNEARQPSRLTPLFFSYKFPYRNAGMLLSSGADINARGKHGQTVLHDAMMRDDPEWIRFLLRHGADPEVQTKAQQSPWMLAVKWKKFRAAALLEEFSRNRHI